MASTLTTAAAQATCRAASRQPAPLAFHDESSRPGIIRPLFVAARTIRIHCIVLMCRTPGQAPRDARNSSPARRGPDDRGQIPGLSLEPVATKGLVSVIPGPAAVACRGEFG